MQMVRQYVTASVKALMDHPPVPTAFLLTVKPSENVDEQRLATDDQLSMAMQMHRTGMPADLKPITQQYCILTHTLIDTVFMTLA